MCFVQSMGWQIVLPVKSWNFMGYPWVSHMSQVRITDLHKFSPWTFTGKKLDIVPLCSFYDWSLGAAAWVSRNSEELWILDPMEPLRLMSQGAPHCSANFARRLGRKWNEPKIRVLRAGDKNWCKTPRKLIVEGRLRNHMLGDFEKSDTTILKPCEIIGR